MEMLREAGEPSILRFMCLNEKILDFLKIEYILLVILME